ncbi:TcpQ domain-containing protein [Escherichia coli]
MLKVKIFTRFILLSVFFACPAKSIAYQDLQTTIVVDKNIESSNARTGKQDWPVKKGQTLHSILSEWGSRSGWDVVWDTEHNYTVSASGVFRDMDINTAVEHLLISMGNMQPQLFVKLYNGNKVILVKSNAGV